MSRELIERTKGKWRSILATLGIPESYLTGKQGPCPMCDGKSRFRFDDKAGSGSWICNHCGSGYGIHLHQRMNNLSMRDALTDIERVLGGLPDSAVRPVTAVRNYLPEAKEIWDASTRIDTGSIAGRYLSGRRLEIPGGLNSIKQNERLLYLDDDGTFSRCPGIVAMILSKEGKPTGIHRTYLKHDASGLAAVPQPRKILGTFPEGAAVRLAKPGDHLGIAEGIETSQSASQLFGIPTWSALTAGGMEKWCPPEGVTAVTIFGDNDKNFRGQQAAFTLAHRLAIRSYRVEVKIPDQIGNDWNDVLRGAA